MDAQLQVSRVSQALDIGLRWTADFTLPVRSWAAIRLPALHYFTCSTAMSGAQSGLEYYPPYLLFCNFSLTWT